MNDYIGRQAAIDALEREKIYSTAYKDGYAQTDYFKQYNMGLTDGIKALNKLPSTEESVKTGKWIGKPIAGYSTVRCSVCKEAFTENTGRWNYCPNCGAKMSKGSEE